ncbi:MAG: ABC transporter ATP-binding protein [Candidatus Binataceae bacterium]
MRLSIGEIELDAGTFHLGPLSLEAAAGEYLVILGPTGAGKTLTLEAIAGLRPIRTGKIEIGGRDVTRAAPEERRVGMLHQDGLLFPHLSVRGNIAYGARRIARAERAAAIAKIAATIGIEPLLGRMPRGLSGGERQRVALARALVASPALLLLDEPMAALDPNSRTALRETLLRLHRELGATSIHVTHSFAEARALADRIAILIGGRILQIGAPGAVFSRPASGEIAQFLRSAALAPEPIDPPGIAPVIRVRGLAIRAGNGAIPEIAAQSAALDDSAAGTDGLVPARVVSAGRMGKRLVIRLSAGLEVEATLESEGAAALEPGAGVWVRVEGD